MADNVAVRARCTSYGNGLGFEDWSQGRDRCRACSSGAKHEQRAYVPGPGPSRVDLASPAPSGSEFAQLLDELVAELVSALESAAQTTPPRESESAISGLFAEIGFGSDPRESLWAAWGFAAGFGLNVIVAKFAQMSAGSPMSELLTPIMVGGIVAGAAGAGIGWGLAKLRES